MYIKRIVELLNSKEIPINGHIIQRSEISALSLINGEAPKNPYRGLCENYELPIAFICTVFPLWEKFSGRVDYPVPVPVPESLKHVYSRASEIYTQRTYLYVGDYGALRLELLEFCRSVVHQYICAMLFVWSEESELKQWLSANNITDEESAKVFSLAWLFNDKKVY